MGAIAAGVGVWNKFLDIVAQAETNEFADGLRRAGAGVKGYSEDLALNVSDALAIVANFAAKCVIAVFELAVNAVANRC